MIVNNYTKDLLRNKFNNLLQLLKLQVLKNNVVNIVT